MAYLLPDHEWRESLTRSSFPIRSARCARAGGWWVTAVPDRAPVARFGFSEDTVRLAAALRPALASRGVPESAFVDNGSAFVDSWLLRACAVLGVKLIHSTPAPEETVGFTLHLFWSVGRVLLWFW